MPIDDIEMNKATRELMLSLTEVGMECQVFASQMTIILRGSPEVGRRLTKGTLEPDTLVDETMEMYSLDEHPLSYHLRCEVAKEAIQQVKSNMNEKA